MARRTLTLLTRPGCGLCDEAMPHLVRATRWLRVQLTVTDITRHPHLEAEYHLRIPVLLGDDGRVLAEGVIGAAAAWKAVLQGRT